MGCGSRINVPSFEQLHGMKACLVAPTKIIAGEHVALHVPSDSVKCIGVLRKEFYCVPASGELNLNCTEFNVATC
jgi:hypothetical protein